jgi:drug/metabolite transporter (DMT)-like permease
MHKASLKDFFLLIVLAAIWGSAFFNIKIASDTYTPMAIAFGRIFFRSSRDGIVLLDEGN